MALPAYAVDYQGHPACPCQVEWLPAFEAEAQRRGFVTGPLPLSQIIGTASTSGNTHREGGADDTYPLDGIDVEGYVWLSRQMGADATWLRPYDWDGNRGVAHVHRVLRGCPHNGPARYQINAVDAGFNGLGHGGAAAPDDGPRPLSKRTWRQGIKWAEEQDMVSPKDWTADDWAAVQEKLVKPLVKAVWDAAVDKSGTAARAALRKAMGK